MLGAGSLNEMQDFDQNVPETIFPPLEAYRLIPAGRPPLSDCRRRPDPWVGQQAHALPLRRSHPVQRVRRSEAQEVRREDREHGDPGEVGGMEVIQFRPGLHPALAAGRPLQGREVREGHGEPLPVAPQQHAQADRLQNLRNPGRPANVM